MCELCKDIRLEIKEPLHKSDLKFIAAIEQLQKAMKQGHFKITLSPLAEKSPYKVVRDIEEQIRKETDDSLYALFAEIVHRWLGLEKLSKADVAVKIGGRIYINPKTGLPLTAKQWKRIKKDLETAFGKIFGNSQDVVAKQAVALGKILQAMDITAAKDLAYDTFADRLKAPVPDYLQPTITFAEQNTAEYITDLTSRARKTVATTIIQAQRERISSRELERKLFDDFAGLNKDWRRIAETELANNVNNGFLTSELQAAAPDETIFMQGSSAAGACPWCIAQVDGVIVVLLDSAPATGDTVEVEGVEYTAIWPGKSNIGRDRASWHVASGVQHPHSYSADTEVLTNDGWKLFKDVEQKDKIMAINPETKEVDFVEHIGKTEHKYNGEMIHFKGRNYDLLVTAPHNMLYTTRKRKGRLVETAAENLLDCATFQLPRAVGRWENGAVEEKTVAVCRQLDISIKSFVKLWAWFLSEGNISKHGSSTLCISIGQKDPTVVASDIDAPFLNVGKAAVTISKKIVTSLFVDYIGVHAPYKGIPSFIKNLPVALIRLFLVTYMKGDGSRYQYKGSKSFSTKNRRAVLYTSSDRMMSDLSELIIKIGRVPSFSKQLNKDRWFDFPNGRYKANHDVWIINICKSAFRYFDRNRSRLHMVKSVQYSGLVYDVELEKWHHLLVRRNGKVAWSGNCKCIWNRYFPELAKYNEKIQRAMRGR